MWIGIPLSPPSSVAYWGQLGAIAGSHWDREFNLGCLGRAAHPHLHDTHSPWNVFVSGQLCLRGSPRFCFPDSCAPFPPVFCFVFVLFLLRAWSVSPLRVPPPILAIILYRAAARSGRCSRMCRFARWFTEPRSAPPVCPLCGPRSSFGSSSSSSSSSPSYFSSSSPLPLLVLNVPDRGASARCLSAVPGPPGFGFWSRVSACSLLAPCPPQSP